MTEAVATGICNQHARSKVTAMPLDETAAALLLNPLDDVAVARRRIAKGEPTGLPGLVAGQLIPRGHKVAMRDVAVGEVLRKFGQVIGVATQGIAAGDHVHLHNLAMSESGAEHQFAIETEETGMLPPELCRSFMGYDRGAGGVGTRNYIGVLTTVNCSATVSRYIADHFNRMGVLTGSRTSTASSP